MLIYEQPSDIKKTKKRRFSRSVTPTSRRRTKTPKRKRGHTVESMGDSTTNIIVPVSLSQMKKKK
jgi:hypothetical protein